MLTAAEYQAMQGRKSPATATKPAQPTKNTKAPVARPEGQEKEPAEKHVQLPAAPADCGPWTSGNWTIRRSVAYEPAARVMLVGPADEFEKLLAHLQAYKP